VVATLVQLAHPLFTPRYEAIHGIGSHKLVSLFATGTVPLSADYVFALFYIKLIGLIWILKDFEALFKELWVLFC